jgi:hypothetical protein
MPLDDTLMPDSSDGDPKLRIRAEAVPTATSAGEHLRGRFPGEPWIEGVL